MISGAYSGIVLASQSPIYFVVFAPTAGPQRNIDMLTIDSEKVHEASVRYPRLLV